jgi:hypothetical protein
MNKDQNVIISEYVASLSEDSLKFYAMRLSECYSGDLAESLEQMSKDKKIDNVLSSACSFEIFFSLIDQIKDSLIKECKKKNVHLKTSNFL